MIKYLIELYREKTSQSKSDFWALSRKYHCVGFSDSYYNTELFGEFFNMFADSEKILSLEVLRKEFPNLSFVGLRKTN